MVYISNMKVYSAILFLIIFVAGGFAQKDIEAMGPCPSILSEGISDFSHQNYTGDWYEIKRYENTLSQRACGILNYKTKQETQFEVSFLSTNLVDHTNKTDTLNLKRTVENKNNGQYIVSIGAQVEEIPHNILFTDYKTFSIVWGCVFTSENLNKQRLFIYSRSKTLSEEANKMIQQKLAEFKLNANILIPVEQEDLKCGRNTGASILIPTLFTFVFAVLLSKNI